MIKLYQTKKLNGHLSSSFYQSCPDVSELELDSVFSWYGDIFTLDRRKSLIFTNELTKFTFLILHYKKSEHPDFAATFKQYLASAMRLHGLDPLPYLSKTDEFGINYKSNKSPIAHLSRFKIDFVPSLKIDCHTMDIETLWTEYTHSYNTYLSTFPNRKGYYEPANIMKDELERRMLL